MRLIFNKLLLLAFLCNKNNASDDTNNISSESYDGDRVVVCYFTDWAVYRSGIAKYTPDKINATLCTHVYYAFASLDNESLTISVYDSYTDIHKGFYKQITALADKGIKAILSLGGWTDSEGDKYSRLVNNATARAAFVEQSIEFLKKYSFVGLDLDWEYPACWQGNCSIGLKSDKENFGNLVKELCVAYKPLGFQLSAAVAAGNYYIKRSYDVPVLGKHLDYIGVMTYDYHSYRDGYTGPDSPFYSASANEAMIESLLYWERMGAPKNKLLAGFPFYSRTYQLKNTEEHGMSAPTIGPGNKGKYTKSKGTLAYYEMCYNVRFNNWTSVRNAENGTYAYYDDQWGSYVNVLDIIQRGTWLKTNGYAGAMIWALDFDDFEDVCGCGAYPLLTALNKIRSIHVETHRCY